MSIILNKQPNRENTSSAQDIPWEASRILELLEKVEEFTIDISRKITKELNSGLETSSKNEHIHIELKLCN